MFFQWSTSLVPQYRPVVDGHFLPQPPEELVKSGHVNVDKVLTGATMDEGLIAGKRQTCACLAYRLGKFV